MNKLITLALVGILALLNGAQGYNPKLRSDSATYLEVNISEFRQANVHLVKAALSQLGNAGPETAPFVDQLELLKDELDNETLSAQNVQLESSSEYWKCMGVCNGREQLLCAKFASIPLVGPKMAAACVLTIGAKCHLDCDHHL